MASYTTITASKLVDISGRPFNGRVTFAGPVDNQGRPMSAVSPDGTALRALRTFLIANGVITGDDSATQQTAPVVDTATTNPAHIGYTVTFYDSQSRQVETPGYTCVQPTGSSWALDQYVPASPPQGALSSEPAGPAGSAATVTSNGSNGSFAVAGRSLKIGVDGMPDFPGDNQSSQDPTVAISNSYTDANSDRNADVQRLVRDAHCRVAFKADAEFDAFQLHTIDSITDLDRVRLDCERSGRVFVGVAGLTTCGPRVVFVEPPEPDEAKQLSAAYIAHIDVILTKALYQPGVNPARPHEAVN